MKIEEYRKKTNEELKNEGLNPKPHLFAINKKSIARIKTILNEKKTDG